jgi:hypothetical protein
MTTEMEEKLAGGAPAGLYLISNRFYLIKKHRPVQSIPLHRLETGIANHSP